jgi:hypothetical protein
MEIFKVKIITIYSQHLYRLHFYRMQINKYTSTTNQLFAWPQYQNLTIAIHINFAFLLCKINCMQIFVHTSSDAINKGVNYN